MRVARVASSATWEADDRGAGILACKDAGSAPIRGWRRVGLSPGVHHQEVQIELDPSLHIVRTSSSEALSLTLGTL